MAESPALPVFVTALLVFVAVVWVRRGDAFVLRWQPDRHTFAAVATGLLAVGFSAAILLFPERSTVARLLHFVGIYTVCGALLPWWYALRVERAGPAALGLRREGWQVALLVGVVAGACLFVRVLLEADFSRATPGYLVVASYQLLVGGLFELFLYYGFIHLRLERAFGPLPAIVGSAAIYTLWHVGTELPMHDDPAAGLTLLFAVGLLYHCVFQLTRHLLSIWPFFFFGGVWNDFAVQLDFPPEMGEGAGWATLALALMLAVPAWLLWHRAPVASEAPA